jgi:hypothetical protein
VGVGLGCRRHRTRQTAHVTWRPWALVKRTVVGGGYVPRALVGVHGRGEMRGAHHSSFHFRRGRRRLPVCEEEDF